MVQRQRDRTPLRPSLLSSGQRKKVERTIRNVAEEFVNLLTKFPEWLTNIWRYRKWYNKHRFHRGINNQPAKLYSHPI